MVCVYLLEHLRIYVALLDIIFWILIQYSSILICFKFSEDFDIKAKSCVADNIDIILDA